MKYSEIDTYLEAVEIRKNMKNVCGTELLVLSRLSDAVKQLRAENEKLKKEKYIEWISVKTLLPPAGERVLAVINDKAVFELYTDTKGKWKRNGIDIEQCFDGEVTKWAYMPDPKRGCEE